MNARLLPLVPLALLSAGCVIETRTGPTQHDSVSIARDKSEFLSVNLSMGAGNLRLSPGTTKFMEGDLLYNVESWKPVVKYTSAAGHGNLEIAQPGVHHGQTGNIKYEWNLKIVNDVPVDLAVKFGAGEARLDLGGVSLRSVDVEMGVGKLDMDLRGNPKHDYEVRIRGGIGEAIVRLPRDVGVYAKAEGGIGDIQASGLRKENGRYINDAYDHSKATIHLDIQGGIGSIKLISD